jgi:hypothetical protein
MCAALQHSAIEGHAPNATMWEANLSFIVAPRQPLPGASLVPTATTSAAAAAASAGERGDTTGGETDTESDAGSSYAATAGTAADDDSNSDAGSDTTDADIWRLVFGSDPPAEDDEDSGAGPWLDLAAISDK